MSAALTRTWANGARQVLNVPEFTRRHPERARYVCTCGTCGRSWDDGHTSSVTPTPGARCPFEYARNHSTTRN